MGHSNGTIYAPVSISDVQSVLGTSANDLGQLCRNTNINMWSRHKPVGYNSITPIGFGDSDGSNEAKTVNYGIRPANYIVNDSGIDTSDVTDLFELSGFDWVYYPPAGGSSQPYRLTDFKGYSHNAAPFIVVEGTGDISVNTAKSSTFTIYATLDPGDSYENLQSYDFAGALIDLSDWFLTVMIDGLFYRATAPVTNSDAGSSVTVPVGSLTTGRTYSTYVFLGRYLTTGGQTENRCKGCMKLPTSGQWNRFPIGVYVYYDSAEAGGGIPDARYNVWILPQYGYDSLGWKVLDSVTDDGSAATKYRFINNNRSLVLKVKMQNTSSTAGTFTRGNFRATNVESGVSVTPESMYTCSTKDGTYTAASSFSVPAGSASSPGVIYVIMVFTQSGGTPFMRGTIGAEEVYFAIRGHNEFYDTINYRYGSTPGWELA